MLALKELLAQRGIKLDKLQINFDQRYGGVDEVNLEETLALTDIAKDVDVSVATNSDFSNYSNQDLVVNNTYYNHYSLIAKETTF